MKIQFIALATLVALSCVPTAEAKWRCTFNWKKSDPNCNRMDAEDVRLTTPFAQCFPGAHADFTGYGLFHFPANETLTAGDWQYRIYEDGVKNKVASDAGDIMKVIHTDGNRWKLNIPFVMPKKQSTGHFTVDFLTKDQDKVQDLCLSMAFNYTWAA